MRKRRILFVAAFIALAFSTISALAGPNVQVLRVPDGGIQPQAVVDSAGAIHLVYFKGDAAGGDLFYVHTAPEKTEFSAAVKVNSVDKSAVAMGSIRGAQIAMGRNNRLHVAWNPAQRSGLKGMQYTRLKDSGDGFEEQKSITTEHAGLDGGGSVAADDSGNVYVVWHAPTSPDGKETGRRVWMARSIDDGQIFASDTPCSSEGTGACGCCALKAYADAAGNLFVLYRSAVEMVHRDTYLLVSGDHGATFKSQMIAPMHLNMCIMSSYTVTHGPGAALAAWETAGQISWAKLDPTTWEPMEIYPLAGNAKRKYPSIAQAGDGTLLLAWAEGTGWNRGGNIAWQIFDSNGQVLEGGSGRRPNLATWSFPAALARPDRTFLIIY